MSSTPPGPVGYLCVARRLQALRRPLRHVARRGPKPGADPSVRRSVGALRHGLGGTRSRCRPTALWLSRTEEARHTALLVIRREGTACLLEELHFATRGRRQRLRPRSVGGAGSTWSLD